MKKLFYIDFYFDCGIKKCILKEGDRYYMMQSKKNRRITAWIAMFAVLFVMLFSMIYISQHIGHECSGSDCPVCAVMGQCSNNIKSIGTSIVITVTGFFLYLSVQKRIQHTYTVFFNCSLISQKVRMND